MSGETLRLLMIEDTQAEADLIRDMLAQARDPSFEIEHALRLAPALEKIREAPFDIVLLDFSLPDSLGMNSLERIREIAPSLPVIILTNLVDQATALKTVRHGAQDYLVKHETDATLLARAIRYAIERQDTEDALRESEERYALAVLGANDGLWDWDIKAGTIFFSPRWKAILGHREEEISGLPNEWHDRIHPDDKRAFKKQLNAHLAGNSEQFRCEYRIQRKDSSYLWVMSRGIAVWRTGDDRRKTPPVRMAGSMSDITARKQAEEQLVHDALHDALTGLPNRALFLDRLGQAIKRMKRRPNAGFAVVFLDLDRFKTVNDSLGHVAGDELLRAIARRLTKVVRDGETVARLGGDEFAVLLTNGDCLASAINVSRRILKILERPFTLEGHEVFTTTSVGIAVDGPDYHKPEEVLRDADIAMYRAKSGGGARYAVFDQEMHTRAMRLMTLESELRRAVERNEFCMHYQPVVSLDERRLVGFEALIRWRHPDGHLVPPSEFIPLAEENGLIIPISWWTLKEACGQARDWQRTYPSLPPLSISVNMSGQMFLQRDMVRRVAGIIDESGVDPQSVRLELTENVVLDHAALVLTTLHALQELGIQLHIDDFGTGYSSLSYLKRFRYDSIKIDKSFIQALGSKEDDAIVSTLLTLGRQFEMNIIAEGVETQSQLGRLRELKCPQGQGYLFSRPLEPAAAASFISRS